MNSKSKLLFLLIPAGLSGVYFSTISGLDLNIFSKEISLVVPLQILALVYVGYYYRRKQAKIKS
ncbi:MAG: hypothetical protein LH474_07880 [Chamaesiphon sp.]|nr:hypothetical protein [Chamaesiphon sp.]